MEPWLDDLRQQVLHGKAVLVSVRKPSPYQPLIDWAMDRELFVYIGDVVRFTPYRRSIWHNPHRPGRLHPDDPGRTIDREESVRLYRRRFEVSPDLQESIRLLRGKVLGCWCAPRACHGDVLIEAANVGR